MQPKSEKLLGASLRRPPHFHRDIYIYPFSTIGTFNFLRSGIISDTNSWQNAVYFTQKSFLSIYYMPITTITQWKIDMFNTFSFHQHFKIYLDKFNEVKNLTVTSLKSTAKMKEEEGETLEQDLEEQLRHT